MSETPADSDRRKERNPRTEAPALGHGIQLFPVSHNKFIARWLLSPESIEAGRRTASRRKEEAQLVLRVYSLPADAGHADFSNTWNDYRIRGAINSAQFTLPTSAAKINAAVGLTNKAGHFTPLQGAMAVNLPGPPPAPAPDKKLCPKIRPFKASGY